MITGLVTKNRKIVLALALRCIANQEILIETVLDTGFNGFLTLSASLIAQLGLSKVGEIPATLGDGSNVTADLFEAKVFWDGEEREALALQMEGGELIGMSLLWGQRFMAEAKLNGRVTIEALP